MGELLIFVGVVAFLISLVALVRPLPRIGLRNRKIAAVSAIGAFVVFRIGVATTPFPDASDVVAATAPPRPVPVPTRPIARPTPSRPAPRAPAALPRPEEALQPKEAAWPITKEQALARIATLQPEFRGGAWSKEGVANDGVATFSTGNAETIGLYSIQARPDGQVTSIRYFRWGNGRPEAKRDSYRAALAIAAAASPSATPVHLAHMRKFLPVLLQLGGSPTTHRLPQAKIKAESIGKWSYQLDAEPWTPEPWVELPADAAARANARS